MKIVENVLISNLDLLATAPNGVARLRELILSLAVQGKLVPQDPSDEPASVLLAETRANRKSLIADGKLKRDRGNDVITKDETPFELAPHWRWARLGSLAEFENGDRGSNYPSRSKFVSEGVAFINAGHLRDGRVDRSDMNYITTQTFNLLRSGKVQQDDILYCLRGSLGKFALIDNKMLGAIASSLVIIRLFKQLSVSYTMLYLASPLASTLIGRFDNGTAQPNLGSGDLAKFIVPVPPLAEQARIVTRVEELMRLCDALEAKGRLEAAQHSQLVTTLLGTLTDSESPEALADRWQRIAEHFDILLDRPEAVGALEQTILQLAVRGLLVRQKSDDKAAKGLLNSIQRRKANLIATGQMKRDAAVAPVSVGQTPFELPNGWEWARIDSIAEVQGGIQKTPLCRPVRRHYPYLRVANVQRDLLLLGEIERFELSDDELAKWRLTTGDLLIVEGNGSEHEVGRCAVWTGQIDPCVYQNHLIRVRCLQPECVEYLKLFLNSPSGTTEMKRLAITTSGLYNLSVGKIRNFVVPLPPLAEQARIVARVKEIRRTCADLRERLSTSQRTQAQFAETLVEAAIG